MNFMVKRICYTLTSGLFGLALLLIGVSPVYAQVDRESLAQDLEELYQERLAGVTRLEITSVMEEGMMQGMESTTILEKVEVEGRPTLRQVDSEGEFEGLFEGMYDDVLPAIVRNATSITEETLDGSNGYRILVEDTEFLASLDPSDAMVDEEVAGDFELESAELFLDAEMKLVRAVSFRQTGEGGEEITVHFRLSDYREHAGFPVPWDMEFELEGLDQMISEEQMAEARRAMEEMESQLEEMPEAQRQMIEEQIMPQMQQFEGLLNSDEPGRAVMRVQDVQAQ
ncbi:MAG: hypothetical protein ACQER4_07720 [Bacteroidota bacterium]